ncbi:MAG: hypothetical protein RMI51_00900 [Aquificaceae bacterium]|nr:hypothetical protein [Aquificaceae bacterium]
MGVLCLLLDRKRLYSHLLTDIFDITGHRLLLATSEEKALSLLETASPEVILLTVEDLPFWLKLLQEDKYLSPLFLLNREEDTPLLKRYGLGESNWVFIPFNPMELLTKMVGLSREPKNPAQAEAMGPTSLLLKLLRLKATISLTIKSSENSCTLYLSEGHIEGSNCTLREVIRLISENVVVVLEPYQVGSVSLKQTFGSNRDFFSALGKDFWEDVVELYENLYWVGVRGDALFQKNAYLRIYRNGRVNVPVLINLGTEQDYSIIRERLEILLGSADAVKGVVLFGSGVDEASGLPAFLKDNQKAFVITSASIARRLSSIKIPAERIRVIESFPKGHLRLASGESLRLIPAPFLPEPGSFVMLEEDRGFLFTGMLLSSLTAGEEFNPRESATPEDVLVYSNLFLSRLQTLRPFLKKMPVDKVSRIYPMYGNPVLSVNDVKLVFSMIGGSKDTHEHHMGLTVKMCEGFLKFMSKNLKGDQFESFVKSLSSLMRTDGERIVQLFTEPDMLLSFMISRAIFMGLEPKLIRDAIRRISLSGVGLIV